MKDLESLTWPITNDWVVSVSGNQVIARESFEPIEGILIPKGSHGSLSESSKMIVCWQVPVNGWQVLLSIHSSLLNQVSLYIWNFHQNIIFFYFR